MGKRMEEVMLGGLCPKERDDFLWDLLYRAWNFFYKYIYKNARKI
jgi:hypothetical protein